ncbi:MAG: hypothetical protein H0W25_14235, partial [Acidimicrobiia bacterium]|nr:hypothetical protein [Acidimicrobiia bacterium]
MDGFEQELEVSLRRVADSIGPAARLDGLVEHRLDVHDRRARLARRTLAGGLVAFVLVAVAVAVAFAGDDVRAQAPQGPSTPRVAGEEGWRTIQPAPVVPRFQHAAVWTGREVVVFGGYPPGGGDPAPGGAAFDPAAGTWRTIASPPGLLGSAVAAWTGDTVLVVDAAGGLHGYDPAADAWQDLPRSPFTDVAATIMHGVWTGDELVVIATARPEDNRPPATSAAYDPATETWRALPGAPFDATFGDAVWTGGAVVVAGSVGG